MDKLNIELFKKSLENKGFEIIGCKEIVLTNVDLLNELSPFLVNGPNTPGPQRNVYFGILSYCSDTFNHLSALELFNSDFGCLITTFKDVPTSFLVDDCNNLCYMSNNGQHLQKLVYFDDLKLIHRDNLESLQPGLTTMQMFDGSVIHSGLRDRLPISFIGYKISLDH